MSEVSDNQETEPQSIDAILDAKFSEPDGPTEPQEEAAPDAENEVLEAEAEDEGAETEEETDETTDPDEGAEEEPQHLDLDEYGELTISVTVNGEEKQVNLSEAAKGYQLQADYSRKTAALADERKQIEAVLENERAALADQRRLLNEQIAQTLEKEPDWVAMAKENPLGYLSEKEAWNQKQAQRQQAQREMQEAEAARVEEFRRLSAQTAIGVMPEWAEDGGFQKNADKRLKAAIDAGFTQAEYEEAVDFRLAVLLEKAALYDAGKTKDTAAAKKLSLAPKVLKPGKSKGKAEVQAARKAKSSRKLDRPHTMEEHLSAFMGD